jgi:hypothetical protein
MNFPNKANFGSRTGPPEEKNSLGLVRWEGKPFGISGRFPNCGVGFDGVALIPVFARSEDWAKIPR